MTDAKPSRDTWKIVRHDGAVLGTYRSKPLALAAAIRFSADGWGYEVVNDTPKTTDADALIVPVRGH